MRNYSIRLSIAQNPKTPLPKTLRLLDSLTDKDLKDMARSKNIPSVVSQGALRILRKKGKA